MGVDSIPVLDQIKQELMSYTNLDGLNDIANHIQNNKHNPTTATYYLLIKKFERGTD